MQILSAKQYGSSLKATIQATGKLGFTKATSDTMALADKACVKFAVDDDPDKTMYIAACAEESEDGFKLLCSSEYYSVPTKALFDALGIDYQSQTVIFDLSRSAIHDAELGGDAYKMKMRTITKTEKNME